MSERWTALCRTCVSAWRGERIVMAIRLPMQPSGQTVLRLQTLVRLPNFGRTDGSNGTEKQFNQSHPVSSSNRAAKRTLNGLSRLKAKVILVIASFNGLKADARTVGQPEWRALRRSTKLLSELSSLSPSERIRFKLKSSLPPLYSAIRRRIQCGALTLGLKKTMSILQLFGVFAY